MKTDRQESRASDETISHRHPLDDVDGFIDPFEIGAEHYNVVQVGSFKGQPIVQNVHAYAVSRAVANVIIHQDNMFNNRQNMTSHGRQVILAGDGLQAFQYVGLNLMKRKPGDVIPLYPPSREAPIHTSGYVTINVMKGKRRYNMTQLLKDDDPIKFRRLLGFLILCWQAGYVEQTQNPSQIPIRRGIVSTIELCFEAAGIPRERIFVTAKDIIGSAQITFHEPSDASAREGLEAAARINAFASDTWQ